MPVTSQPKHLHSSTGLSAPPNPMNLRFVLSVHGVCCGHATEGAGVWQSLHTHCSINQSQWDHEGLE